MRSFGNSKSRIQSKIVKTLSLNWKTLVTHLDVVQCNIKLISPSSLSHSLNLSLFSIFLHCSFYVDPNECHYYQDYDSFFRRQDLIRSNRWWPNGDKRRRQQQKHGNNSDENLSSMNPIMKRAVKRFLSGKKSHFCSLSCFHNMLRDYHWISDSPII